LFTGINWPVRVSERTEEETAMINFCHIRPGRLQRLRYNGRRNRHSNRCHWSYTVGEEARKTMTQRSKHTRGHHNRGYCESDVPFNIIIWSLYNDRDRRHREEDSREERYLQLLSFSI